MASVLTVYFTARVPPLLTTTQDSFPAGGQPLPGGGGYPPGLVEEFQTGASPPFGLNLAPQHSHAPSPVFPGFYKPSEGEQVTVVKSLNIPLDFPLDIIDNNFEIRYNEDMNSESAAYDDAFNRHGGHGPSLPNFYSASDTTLSKSTPGIFRTSELYNTYYLYTFDGTLLAEYDHNGNCVRDYIYAGNRLIAEYKPQTDEYFYYMTDQINSTQIITNDSGNVVFSEAYGPYGDVQKTWTNTYNPKLKFSGKEREGYSELDYFGARYYDHKSYRFNSVDPIINKEEALSNPQLWNLYSFCDNNPITFLDPDGREITKIEVFHGKSEVKFYSDSGEVYTSPAALGRPRSPSPKPGTTAYAEGGVKAGPRRPDNDIVDARTEWDPQDNPGNPYGPYMVRLKKNKEEFHRKKNNMKTHIHGTKGGWGKSGDTSNLGSSDPKNRRITSGCVRVPNADIRKIYKEGVKKMHPFTLKNSMYRYFLKHLCIVLMILSLTLCTIIADEIIEKKELKSSNGDTGVKTFFAFIDDKSKGFEQTIEYIKGEEKYIYKISRINIDGPYYDGIRGYNVLKIRKESFPAPIDVLTLMVRGHFRLFGYDIEKNEIYAFRTFQIGADALIDNIVIISKKSIKEKDEEFDESHIPDEIDIEIIGPSGEYDYGSCSPDGKFCILFFGEATVIDLQKKAIIKNNIGINSIPEASPDGSYTKEGTIIGGSYNLSGEFKVMKWETNTSGNLICRDRNNKVLKIFKIDLGKFIEE